MEFPEKRKDNPDYSIDVIYKDKQFQVKCFLSGAEEVEERLYKEKGEVISR